MAEQRKVAGLWCADVLEHLDAYIDGTLPDDVRERAEAHLAECDWCTRFGGAYAKTVAQLRATLDDPPEPWAEDRVRKIAGG